MKLGLLIFIFATCSANKLTSNQHAPDHAASSGGDDYLSLMISNGYMPMELKKLSRHYLPPVATKKSDNPIPNEISYVQSPEYTSYYVPSSESNNINENPHISNAKQSQQYLPPLNAMNYQFVPQEEVKAIPNQYLPAFEAKHDSPHYTEINRNYHQHTESLPSNHYFTDLAQSEPQPTTNQYSTHSPINPQYYSDQEMYNHVYLPPSSEEVVSILPQNKQQKNLPVPQATRRYDTQYQQLDTHSYTSNHTASPSPYGYNTFIPQQMDNNQINMQDINSNQQLMKQVDDAFKPYTPPTEMQISNTNNIPNWMPSEPYTTTTQYPIHQNSYNNEINYAENDQKLYNNHVDNISKPYNQQIENNQKPYDQQVENNQKPYTNHVDNNQKPYNNHAEINPKPYANHVENNPKPYNNHAEINPKPYANHVDNNQKPYTNYVDNNQKTYNNHVDNNQKIYHVENDQNSYNNHVDNNQKPYNPVENNQYTPNIPYGERITPQPPLYASSRSSSQVTSPPPSEKPVEAIIHSKYIPQQPSQFKPSQPLDLPTHQPNQYHQNQHQQKQVQQPYKQIPSIPQEAMSKFPYQQSFTRNIQNTVAYVSGPTTEAMPILKQTSEMELDGSYNYETLTGDQTHIMQHGHIENPGTDHEEQVMQGSYSFVGDDGKTYTVNYIADANGFRATGDHLPTPPPIPDVIQRSIEFNMAEEAAKAATQRPTQGYQYPQVVDNRSYQVHEPARERSSYSIESGYKY